MLYFLVLGVSSRVQEWFSLKNFTKTHGLQWSITVERWNQSVYTQVCTSSFDNIQFWSNRECGRISNKSTWTLKWIQSVLLQTYQQSTRIFSCKYQQLQSSTPSHSRALLPSWSPWCTPPPLTISLIGNLLFWIEFSNPFSTKNFQLWKIHL